MDVKKELLKITDETELLELNKLICRRIREVRRSESANSMAKFYGVKPGARLQIDWNGRTYHGTFKTMNRTTITASIDERGGKSYRVSPGMVSEILDGKKKGTSDKPVLGIVPGGDGDEAERLTEAYAIRDEARKLHDELLKPLGEKIDWDERKKQEDAIWERVQKLDERSKPGLRIGRLCSWQVADGYAHYIVVGVGRRVKLIHISLWDAYQSDAVDDRGTATKTTVERNIGFHDSMNEIFSKRKKASSG